jgi:exonuclease VII small subunit
MLEEEKMVDPVISGAGKAGTELFKEASKQLQNASEQVSKFEELRSKMEVQEVVGPKNAGQDSLQVQKPEQVQDLKQVDPTKEGQKVGEIPKVTDMAGLEKAVNQLRSGQSKLNDLIKECTSGRTFTPQELLGMQAQISDITTQISFYSKIVEQGVSAVKSTMQMQV